MYNYSLNYLTRFISTSAIHNIFLSVVPFGWNPPIFSDRKLTFTTEDNQVSSGRVVVVSVLRHKSVVFYL